MRLSKKQTEVIDAMKHGWTLERYIPIGFTRGPRYSLTTTENGNHKRRSVRPETIAVLESRGLIKKQIQNMHYATYSLVNDNADEKAGVK